MKNNKTNKKFLEWFVGVSDGESCFLFTKKVNSDGSGVRFGFAFQLGLHFDDIGVLNYIQKTLGFGRVVEVKKESECRFIVSDLGGIEKLIDLFDKFNLNTTKHMDYLAFKKAFLVYKGREGAVTESLVKEILEIKNQMNNNRTDFTYPADHQINITASWLLGVCGSGKILSFIQGGIETCLYNSCYCHTIACSC